MKNEEYPGLLNPVRTRMEAGELALGMVIRLSRSGDIARIAHASGHDFIFLDRQHALFSTETIGDIAQAAHACGVAPLVRVRSCRDPDVAVLLDSGVTGIVFPDVNCAEDARLAVKTCRFAPLGERSLTASYTIFHHRPIPLPEVMSRLNEHTLIVCMIETRQGLENIEEIAAVEGVDVLLLGLTDLLADMGKPGISDTPEADAAVERAAAATAAHGKFLGVGGEPDISRIGEFVRAGARFIPTQSDISYLLAEASRTTRDVRRAGRLALERGSLDQVAVAR